MLHLRLGEPEVLVVREPELQEARQRYLGACFDASARVDLEQEAVVIGAVVRQLAVLLR